MFGNVVVYTKHKPNGTYSSSIDIRQSIVSYDMVYVLVKSWNCEATEEKMIETHVTCVRWNVNKSRNFCFHDKHEFNCARLPANHFKWFDES